LAEKQLKLIEREKELLDKDQTVSTLREEVTPTPIASGHADAAYLELATYMTCMKTPRCRVDVSTYDCMHVSTDYDTDNRST